MAVRLVKECKVVGLDTASLRRCAQLMKDQLGYSHLRLKLSLNDSEQMRFLNSLWRGKPAPTDVLSFQIIKVRNLFFLFT